MTDIELRHGYTLDDVHKLTGAACLADRLLAMDYHTKRDIAWSAIALHLYEADAPPTRQQLIRTGWQAIYAEVRTGLRERGYESGQITWTNSSPNRPRFVQYWAQATTTPSPETRIIERIAIRQVLAAIVHPLWRDAIASLAATGDYQVAADALDINRKAFNVRIAAARRRALQLWHDGETPHRPRHVDRRVNIHGRPLSQSCIHGHEWTIDNTRIHVTVVRGKIRRRRFCRACERARKQARKRART